MPLERFRLDERTSSGYGSICKDCANKSSVEWKKKNPDRYAKALWRCRLQKEYGIDEEEYDKMFDRQNGVCAICGKPESRLHSSGKVTKLCVDHDHDTGRVRGLLCHRCNTVIGMLNSVELLDKAKSYIKEIENGEED